MRSTLRYGAAVGILATAFTTLGPVSAYAGQIPGTSTPVHAVLQNGAPGNQQGQMNQQYRRYCRYWSYGYGHHRTCRTWYYR